MRWVFIKPRNHSPYYDPEIQEPLGLEYLSGYRRSRGDCVLLLDGCLDSASERTLARRAVSFQPNVVGFSLTTGQDVASVLTIHAEFLRAETVPSCFWLAGGNFISTEPECAASLLPEDFLLVRFEGEKALDVVAESWGTNGSSSVKGDARPRERLLDGTPVPDLDTLPFPDRPQARGILDSGWALNLQGSRGCFGACRYCASPGMRQSSGKRWRGRSPANIVEEVERLWRDFGACSFNFVDEDFLGPNHLAGRRASAFAEEIRRRDLRISFGIQVRPGSLSEAIIDTLTDVGLTYVFMGIESDCPEDFRRWGRPWTSDPWALVTRLRQRGAEVNAGTLMFHSHSTLTGIRRFAGKLREYRLLEYRSARNRLDAMPGSTLYEEGVRQGAVGVEGAVGPQPVPFLDAAVDRFYRDLLLALDPLGPPSMHALCALPPLLARRRFDARQDARCRELERIVAPMDHAVAVSMFELLDLHQQQANASAGLVSCLRRRNLEIAVQGAKNLATQGFTRSFDEIRNAIRLDTGL